MTNLVRILIRILVRLYGPYTLRITRMLSIIFNLYKKYELYRKPRLSDTIIGGADLVNIKKKLIR